MWRGFCFPAIHSAPDAIDQSDHPIGRFIYRVFSRLRPSALQSARIEVIRDWGWAPDYVEAIYLMMRQDKPEDFVIATGESYSLKDFVKEAFNQLDMDWEKHCKIDEKLIRPADFAVSKADPSKAKQMLKWSAHKKIKESADELICLYTSADFYAVGQFYENFSAVSDETVTQLIEKANRKQVTEQK